MSLCAVRCSECTIIVYGPEPARMEYRNMVIDRRLVPVCEECYEDHRKKERERNA